MARGMKSYVFVAAGLVVLIVLALALVDWIPPVALTRGRLHLLEIRIREYYAAHNCLPSSMVDLPIMEKNRDSELVDEWGRPIRYTVKGKTVGLVSLGKDGQFGGAGEDSDIQVAFTVGDEASKPTTQR